MEYLAVFSVAFLMIMPMIVIYMTQSNNLKQKVVNAQVEKASSTIIDTAEEVHYMGPPTQKTIRVSFPAGITGIDIYQTVLRFNVSLGETQYSIVKEAVTNLTGSLRKEPGPHKLVIKAEETGINIEDS